MSDEVNEMSAASRGSHDMSDMKYDALIADLSCQYERYRGSGTRMEQTLKDAGAALAKARLTDEEREAVEWFATFGNSHLAPLSNNWSDHAATLRSLLARLA